MTSWQEAAEIFQSLDPNFKGWKASQESAKDLWYERGNQRMLLFFPTGEGKTKTSLGILADQGYEKIFVIAPPKTHDGWIRDAKALGMDMLIMSVEKFRRNDTPIPKGLPMIVDEFHMTGKHNGPAFKRMARMARQFPGILLVSATPNYNDADRVYCVDKILAPEKTVGLPYFNWIQLNCVTTPNPFALTPIIDGLIGYPGEKGAVDWLLAQGYTAYVEDTAEWEPQEWHMHSDWDRASYFDKYGYDASRHKMIASDMERRHREKFLEVVDGELIRPEIMEQFLELLDGFDQEVGERPILVFAHHETIASALYTSLKQEGMEVFLITGTQTEKNVQANKAGFLNSSHAGRFLIGTSSLATGVDGIDKVCDTLIIFDDIEGDDAKRRQLIGRVLPRGTGDRTTHVVHVHVTTQ